MNYQIRKIIQTAGKELGSEFNQQILIFKFSLCFRNCKWEMGNGVGSVGGIVVAPIDKVWTMVSQTKKLPIWMQMVEQCSDLVGEEGMLGYVRLVSGFMFPQQDGERSWIKGRLVSMDSSSHSFV